MSKNCQNITERAKEQQCMSEVKETLKKLWQWEISFHYKKSVT